MAGAEQWFRLDLTSRTVEARSPRFPQGLGVWPEQDANRMARIAGHPEPAAVRVEDLDLIGSEVQHERSFPGRYGGHVRLTADGARLVYVNEDGSVFSTGLREGQTRAVRRDHGTVRLVDVGSPAPLFLTASGLLNRQALRLWNLDTLTSTPVLRAGEFAPLAGHLSSAVWHGSGRVALGSSEGGVGVVEARTRWPRFFRHRHQGEVHGLAFSPDGALLAPAGQDGAVRVWDATRGEELAAFEGQGVPVRAVAFSPGGGELVSVDERGEVCFWPLETAAHLLDLAPTPAGQDSPGGPGMAHREGLDREAYLARAHAEGVEAFAEAGWALHGRWPGRPRPRQGAENLVSAYYEARDLLPEFTRRVDDLAGRVGVQVRHRPDGVKQLDRVVEKMKLNTALIPTDLLGATLVCTSLREMYAARTPRTCACSRFTSRARPGRGRSGAKRWRSRSTPRRPTSCASSPR